MKLAECVVRGGLLPVDKPVGPTSHDIIDVARRALGTRKIGHAGTLDPFASGLLLVCVGPATRLSEYLVGLDKEYDVVIRLGVVTETGDPEGKVLQRDERWREIEPSRIESTALDFVGPIRQVPPAYSAKKVRGETAYRRARRGEEVELDPVDVTVDLFRILDIELPSVTVRVRCSSGTYVRALARDFGERLGVGAHAAELRRSSVGAVSIESALPLDALEPPIDTARISRSWLEAPEALGHLPQIEVNTEEARRLAMGQGLEREAGEVTEDAPILAVLEDRLVAVVARRGELLRPRKVFLPQ